MTQFVPLLPIFALLALAACSKQAAEPAAAGSASAVQAGAGAAPGALHELVQVVRKDPADHDWRFTRETIYEICKIGADALKVPVKPFPPMPAGFGEERITTFTDGKSSTIMTETSSRFDESKAQAETGCEFRIDTKRQSAITIDHGLQTIAIERDGDGPGKVLETNERPDMSAYRRVQDTKDYTEARTVNGVPMRCLPKDFWTLNTNKYMDLRAMCVYHKDGVLMNEAQEESIILLSHVMANILNPQFAHTVITEPLSVRVRAATEPNPFQAATWTK